MAEQIPYGVAESLIKRLASAVFHEFGRINGVMDELERLKNTVESIRVVLLDAEEKQEQNHAVQNWIRRLKDDVLHPADNLLDEFVIEDMRRRAYARQKNKVTKVFFSLSPNRISFRYKMAHEIEKMQKTFNDVVNEMSKLNLSQNVVVLKQTGVVKRETSSFVLESDIIGRENNKKEIINLLRQTQRNHVSLIAIVGIGGLGKTALAQLVYNDSEVEHYFEKKIWVCVSENFDVKTIVQKMLESLMDDKIDDSLSLDNLQNSLRQNLCGQRYLLVLDDIWNESHQQWTELRTYLMCGAKDSKILVTTRSKTVAQIMGVSDSYVLNGLTSDESWGLLKNIVTYGNENQGMNEALESIGKNIAKKCSGVPLAIRTLGGLLQSKNKESEWNNVLQGNFWRLCQDENNIMPVLKLSYQNLSPQQRQCFAYCSIYPKDWEIEKDEWIQLCMAQGYLECSLEIEHMEDVGNQFVKIFLTKSFFQDAKMDEDGDIYSFKMHDLMHDLAMQVASKDRCSLDRKTKGPLGRPMHLAFQRNAIRLLDSLDASRLRTLVLLSSSPYWTGLDGDESSIISNFKNLRVLKLSNSSLTRLSGSIEKLKHLRYIDLYDCKASIYIFKSISNLVCLQTLKFRVRGISPREFKMLQYGGINYSNWLSSLTNIVEISITCCDGLQFLPSLERLPFLKSLHIKYLRMLKYIHYEKPLLPEKFFPSLENLKLEDCKELRGWCRIGDHIDSLQSCHLSFPPFPILSQLTVTGCQMLTSMPTFPKLDKELELNGSPVEALNATLNNHILSLPPLSMLKSLCIGEHKLAVHKISENWMQNLTSLQHLQIEYFSSQQFLEIATWFNDDFNCLPSLQKLTLQYCDDLKALPDWICKLSSLQHVTIGYFVHLASVPEGMPRLTKLHTLEIIGCPLLVKECETQASATQPKIAHIPNIILRGLI